MSTANKYGSVQSTYGSGYSLDEQFRAFQNAKDSDDDGGSSGANFFLAGGGFGPQFSTGANQAPIIRTKNLEVLGDEYLKGRDVLKARDRDGDAIVRYRVVHFGTKIDDNEGYFELDGVKMAQNRAFFVDADQVKKLKFFSAPVGQHLSYPDQVRLSAFDGTDWSSAKVVDILTLHNQYRPVVLPHHQELIAQTKVNFQSFFRWIDADGNSVKWYEFRDRNAADDSAYFVFKGNEMQGTGWFRVKPDELRKLNVVAGDVATADNFQIRSSDGRHTSLVKTAVLSTLARPIVDINTNVVLNELERRPLDELFTDGSSVPPITSYEVMDLGTSSLSATIVQGFRTFAPNQVHQIDARELSTYDLRGGRYDQSSRDPILVRAFNGQFWSAWERLETITEPHYIDALLTGSDWTQFLNSPPLGEPLTITYSFLQRVPDYYADGAPERRGFGQLTTDMRQNIRSILDELALIIDVRFVEVSDLVGGTIRIGAHDQGNTNPGHSFIPMDEALDERGGDIWLNNKVDFGVPVNWIGTYSNMEPGTIGLAFMRRLVGEAMGLRIPVTGSPLLPAATYSHRYTAMAHNFAFQVPVPDGDNLRYAESYKKYDVAALREAYGAKADARDGNDIYRFSPNRHTVTSIIDTGGIDTIDVGNQPRRATIDLRQGAYSSFGEELGFFGPVRGVENLGISYGSEIENASGTRFRDTLIGNELDNVLNGRRGNDSLTGLAGNDTLIGGEGNDNYFFNLYGDHDTINDGSTTSVDTLTIRTHSNDLNNFTTHLAFKKAGSSLVVALTLNQNGSQDLIDGTVKIKNMTGREGVETLRVLDHDGNNLFGDIDLMSAFNDSKSGFKHFAITANSTAFGQIVARV